MKIVLKIVFALLLLGLLVGGTAAWFMFGQNTKNYDEARGVKIPRSASFDTVVDSLKAARILRSARTFSWMARATGWGDQIKAGYYEIESGGSNYDLLNTLRKGLQKPIRLTIPPGTRPEVVAAVIGRDMDYDRQEVLDALRDPAFAAELGTDTTHLFGYMLPETYSFYWLTPPRTIIRRIKQQTDSFFDEEMMARADSLGLSKDDVLILAGIVEWETAVTKEKPTVAGVYLNRLRTPGWRLQADPTVQYAIMQREGQKRRLFNVDYQINHPYNTYRIDGLPPGPITNPAPSSIRAVLNPDKHNYMYFVAKGDGSHVFSRTLAEHNRAARRFHSLMRERRQRQREQAREDSLMKGR